MHGQPRGHRVFYEQFCCCDGEIEFEELPESRPEISNHERGFGAPVIELLQMARPEKGESKQMRLFLETRSIPFIPLPTHRSNGDLLSGSPYLMTPTRRMESFGVDCRGERKHRENLERKAPRQQPTPQRTDHVRSIWDSTSSAFIHSVAQQQFEGLHVLSRVLIGRHPAESWCFETNSCGASWGLFQVGHGPC